MPQARCDLCHDPVDITRRSTYMVLVQGWLAPTATGGGQPQLRQVIQGHWAHELCVRRARQRIPVNQGQLEV